MFSRWSNICVHALIHSSKQNSVKEKYCGSSFLFIPIYFFILFKTKKLKFSLVLKHDVTVSVYEVFQCLLSYYYFLTFYQFYFCSYLGVTERKTEGNTWLGLFPVFFEMKQPDQLSRYLLQLFRWIFILLLSPSILTDINVKSYVLKLL